MYDYRITKYNPENRNSDGHYLKDEWTCPSEIGRMFNGIEFEEHEYFEVERKYILSVFEILTAKSISHLRVINLSNNFTEELLAEKDNQWLVNDNFLTINLFEDKAIYREEIEIVIKMILRNFVGCRLELDGIFSLRFSWDFYMYACTLKCDPSIIDKIHRLGMFIEELDSKCDLGNYDFSLQVVKKNDDDGFVEEEIMLENMTRDKIKQGLHLSHEHTGNLSFQITIENSAIFSDKFEFNFDEKEYYLSCDMNYT